MNIIGFNSPEWHISIMGAVAAGGELCAIMHHPDLGIDRDLGRWRMEAGAGGSRCEWCMFVAEMVLMTLDPTCRYGGGDLRHQQPQGVPVHHQALWRQGQS